MVITTGATRPTCPAPGCGSTKIDERKERTPTRPGQEPVRSGPGYFRLRWTCTACGATWAEGEPWTPPDGQGEDGG